MWGWWRTRWRRWRRRMRWDEEIVLVDETKEGGWTWGVVVEMVEVGEEEGGGNGVVEVTEVVVGEEGDE